MKHHELLAQSREFPKLLQIRIYHPPCKKPSLDRNLLKNYRQVSSLTFISKLIKKVVAKQLNTYIKSEGFSNVNQSAYKRMHSTETALLKIQNDIAASMDSGKVVVLILQDLSAAFDTSDHNIIFNCLRDWFGEGNRWLNRRLNSVISFQMPSYTPVWTTPISDIISSFNVTHHLYADDTQMYVALDHIGTLILCFAELTECLTCVQKWMDGVKPESPSCKNFPNFLEIPSSLPI